RQGGQTELRSRFHRAGARGVRVQRRARGDQEAHQCAARVAADRREVVQAVSVGAGVAAVRIHKSLLVTTLGFVPLALLARAGAAEQQPPGLYGDLAWRMIGPFRGGRTRAVAGVPAQEHVFYIGAVNGGVWKTQDAGRTWQPIFDSEPTQSIGALAVAPSDPNVLYVGSGEGLLRPDLSVGNGIYRSSDGGVSWSHRGLTDAQQIPELAVDPGDPNRVFAAVLGHPYGPSGE